HQRSVTDERLELFTYFLLARTHRALEGDEAAAGLDPDAQRRSPCAKCAVGRVEQAIVLEAPAAHRRCAGGQHRGARVVGARKPELDLAFEGHGHRRVYLSAARPELQRDRTAEAAAAADLP